MTQNTLKTYALDTESFYCSEINVVTMGPRHYARATDIYLLTVVGEDGYEYAGHPKDFDWSMLRGARIVMANAPFDLTMLESLGEKGVIPANLGFAEVVDVLDMSRYLGRPGSLKGAVDSLLGKLAEESGGIDKSTRANMKGKRWEEMSNEFRAEVLKYATDDAKWTLVLWQSFNHLWPWHEQQLSRQTREMCMRGIPVDVEKAKGYAKHLKGLIWEAEQNIPWAKEGAAKILSPKALAEECRKVGITPPTSLAQDSEECAAWEEKYGEQFPWVAAMRDWRRCNILLKKVETFIKRTKPDGWMPFGLKYFGAGSTGRFSGDSGLNVQNLNRKALYDVDLRSLIKAPPGFKIAAADLSAIEPRCCGPTTLILTDSGYKFIPDVTPIDKVWDGCEFVSHGGVTKKAKRETNSRLGHEFTDDHLIFTGEESTKPSKDVCPRSAFHFRNTSWAEVGGLVYFAARTLAREIKQKILMSLYALWERKGSARARHSSRGV